jgi:diguanylate cyclase (GGDEF)-like protein
MRPSRLTLTTKFAVASAVLMVLIGALAAHEIRSQVRSRSLASAVQAAEIVARSAVEPMLSHGELSRGLTAAETASVDNSFTSGLQRTGVAEMVVYDRTGRILYSSNHEAIGTTPDSAELPSALQGKTMAELTHHAHAGEVASGVLLEVYVPLRPTGANQPEGALELYLPFAPYQRTADGDVRRLSAFLGFGLLLLWVALFRVVSHASRALTRQRDENEHLALHDPLTGLANRALFADRTEYALRQAHRRKTPLAVMLMDLDRFKEVNDTLGHHSGDKLLKEVALRLATTVREVDTIARLGGDEFAVLLPDTDVQGAREAAARIHKAFDDIFVVDDLALDLSASIGAAVHPEHGDSSSGLLQRADVAMYVAKESKSGLEFYAPDRDQNSPARLSLAGDLRRAIDEHELVLHYQPKVDATTRKVVGVEALVRWQHPEQGLVPPVEFIGLAEKTGLIKPLTMAVLDMALAQTVDWLEEGIRLPVAVNLSPISLIDRSLPDEISAALRRWGVPAELLELEVTESSLMHDPLRASEILSDVSAMGVTIAIDDFGTGYSSLGWLRQLPIDELKIDRSFVSAITTSAEGMIIVESTVQLARNLDIRVVAEGVEDEQVAAALARLDCDMFQGFLISRPLPAAEFSHWLAAHRPTRRRSARKPGRHPVPAGV